MYILFTFEYFSYTLCRLSLYSVHMCISSITFLFCLGIVRTRSGDPGLRRANGPVPSAETPTGRGERGVMVSRESVRWVRVGVASLHQQLYLSIVICPK